MPRRKKKPKQKSKPAKEKPLVWSPPDLRGKVAVVTGASRGAGRGIARVLGECGATVYVTGRSVRGAPTTEGVAGTIDDTAEEVTRRGGRGLPVRCDHTVEADVEALFERVRREQGRLDILVNNAWGGYERYDHTTFGAPFWEQPLAERWRGMFDAGLRTHFSASYYAVPLMRAAAGKNNIGLIVSTVAWVFGEKYMGNPYYYVSKRAIAELARCLGEELRKHRVAAVALAPGFMRTERVLGHFEASEDNWKNFPHLAQTESPEYVGRAVARLAADRNLLRKSGGAFESGGLAREYGFPDIDGRPVPPWSEVMG